MSSAEHQDAPSRHDVVERVQQLARVVPLVDVSRPRPERALPLDESQALISSRYREALYLLGTL